MMANVAREYTSNELAEGRMAANEALKRSWDWKGLAKHSNPMVRKAARANLTHGRQTVTEKRSVGIGTAANYFGSGKVSVGVTRGVAVTGTGKPGGT